MTQGPKHLCKWPREHKSVCSVRQSQERERATSPMPGWAGADKMFSGSWRASQPRQHTRMRSLCKLFYFIIQPCDELTGCPGVTCKAPIQFHPGARLRLHRLTPSTPTLLLHPSAEATKINLSMPHFTPRLPSLVNISPKDFWKERPSVLVKATVWLLSCYRWFVAGLGRRIAGLVTGVLRKHPGSFSVQHETKHLAPTMSQPGC